MKIKWLNFTAATVALYVIVTIFVYRAKHPDKTESQLLFNLHRILIWDHS